MSTDERPNWLPPADKLATASTEAAVVEILPTRIWIESDMVGARHVVCQHQDMEPFTYASFHYDYAYTSNAGTWEAAHALARSLGAAEPVETRQRELGPPLTAEEIRDHIKGLTAALAHMEGA